MITKSLRNLCKRSRLLVSMARRYRYGLEFYQREKLFEGWHRRRAALIKDYLESHPLRKLQIGAMEHILPGWLNTDLQPLDGSIAFMDARQPFPLGDRTFDYILWEHCIEHITYAEAASALRECYRILRPGGRLRIATPNLSAIIGLWVGPRNEMQDRYIKWYIDSYTPEYASYAPCFLLNNTFHLWGHQFIYDHDTLASLLKATGFSGLSWFAPGESEDENLRGIEGHYKRAGDEMNKFESMIVEAVRPATDLVVAPGSQA